MIFSEKPEAVQSASRRACVWHIAVIEKAFSEELGRRDRHTHARKIARLARAAENRPANLVADVCA